MTRIIVVAASIGMLAACATPSSMSSDQMSTSASVSADASPLSKMTAAEIDSMISKGMTKNQVRAALGEPTSESFTSEGVLWAYANSGQAGFNSSTSRVSESNSGASQRSVGRGLGTIIGGTLGRVARGAGDMAEGMTGRTRTSRSTTQSSGSYGDLDGAYSIGVMFGPNELVESYTIHK